MRGTAYTCRALIRCGRIVGLLAPVALLAAACGGPGQGSPATEQPEVKSLCLLWRAPCRSRSGVWSASIGVSGLYFTRRGRERVPGARHTPSSGFGQPNLLIGLTRRRPGRGNARASSRPSTPLLGESPSWPAGTTLSSPPNGRWIGRGVAMADATLGGTGGNDGPNGGGSTVDVLSVNNLRKCRFVPHDSHHKTRSRASPPTADT